MTSDYELYIMRHGIAEDRGVGGVIDDAKRPLTRRVRRRCARSRRALNAQIGSGLDCLQPARPRPQTAEIVGGHNQFTASIGFL